MDFVLLLRTRTGESSEAHFVDGFFHGDHGAEHAQSRIPPGDDVLLGDTKIFFGGAIVFELAQSGVAPSEVIDETLDLVDHL